MSASPPIIGMIAKNPAPPKASAHDILMDGRLIDAAVKRAVRNALAAEGRPTPVKRGKPVRKPRKR